MKSRIFSSKHLKTISKGQIWIPAFITLGFLQAFPVTGMVKLSSWRDLQYSDLQILILYNNLWKDGCAVGSDHCIHSGFHKQCERIHLSVFW